MFSVRSTDIPRHGLLESYMSREGCFTDCYYADLPRLVSLEEMISAFFNTPAFQLERKLMGWFASRPSTRAEVESLARGLSDTLAFWKVETREENQMIMTVEDRPIRTWLMVQQLSDNPEFTRIYFGSAMLPKLNEKTGKTKMDPLFYVLRGFHKAYSRVLLGLAKSRLKMKR